MPVECNSHTINGEFNFSSEEHSLTLGFSFKQHCKPYLLFEHKPRLRRAVVVSPRGAHQHNQWFIEL